MLRKMSTVGALSMGQRGMGPGSRPGRPRLLSWHSGYGRAQRASRVATQDLDVGRVRPGNAFGTDIAERQQIETGEQILACPEQNRGNDQMKLVEQARLQELPHDRNAAADTDVL